MTDWLGTTTFELDLLLQLTAATDHAGKRAEYTYDGMGNQTSIAYPDGTTATYDYDLVHNQTKVTETDGSEISYTYDGMGRVTEMRYPTTRWAASWMWRTPIPVRSLPNPRSILMRITPMAT